MIEDFTWKALDLLSKLDRLREMLTSPELPDDLNTAKLMIEHHNRLRKKVVKAPIDALEVEGQHTLQRICGGTGRHCRNTGNIAECNCITKIR